MNIETRWYIKDRVAYVHMSGIIGVNEMVTLNEQITAFIEDGVAVGAPLVHFLVDDSGVTETKLKLNQINSVMPVIRHRSFGWAITIGNENPFVKILVYLVSQLARVRFRRVNTRQEAIDFLISQDQTLDWEFADESVFAEDEFSSN